MIPVAPSTLSAPRTRRRIEHRWENRPRNPLPDPLSAPWPGKADAGTTRGGDLPWPYRLLIGSMQSLHSTPPVRVCTVRGERLRRRSRRPWRLTMAAPTTATTTRETWAEALGASRDRVLAAAAAGRYRAALLAHATAGRIVAAWTLDPAPRDPAAH